MERISNAYSEKASTTRRIDAHVHLWKFDEESFTWLDPVSSSKVRRDFLPADLSKTLGTAHVDGAIAVQACRTVAETEWLLECSDRSTDIIGVVGWVPLMDYELSNILDRLAAHAGLVGVREIVEGFGAGYLDQPAFHSGIEMLSRYQLSYDLLISEGQLNEATRLVDHFPNQQFILDHAAKPLIAANELEPWRSALKNFARRSNVVCKLSGFLTEAHWHRWTLESMYPYLDVCVEAFGVNRLMVGSDWPVCLLAGSQDAWWTVLESFFAASSDSERQAIFGGSALATYQIRY